ncbi:MAG: PsbP-related protein [Candidatus Omnitrophica bacterium]|nr:PsbP-related protein [Candidatus Omnitrophota bacterium]
MTGLRIKVMTLALMMVASAAGTPVFAASLKVFKHNQLKYSVSYPADFLLKQLGSGVSFSSPDTDKKFGFAPSVNIVSQKFGSAVPALADFYKKAKEPLVERKPPVKIIEEKKDKVAGIDSQRLVYASKEKKANFKFLQQIFIRKGRAYVITYTALAEQYDRYLPAAKAIIRSFEFND